LAVVEPCDQLMHIASPRLTTFWVPV
jgi:hypothetical protein